MVLERLRASVGFGLSRSGTGQGRAQVVRRGGESVIARSHKRLGAVSAMGKAQAAQTDQFVLMDCFVSKEREKKKKSVLIFPLLVATSFEALFGKLVRKPAPTLDVQIEHTM